MTFIESILKEYFGQSIYVMKHVAKILQNELPFLMIGGKYFTLEGFNNIDIRHDLQALFK